MIAHFRVRQKFSERIKFLPCRKFLSQLYELPSVISISYQKFFSVVRKIKFAFLFNIRLKFIRSHKIILCKNQIFVKVRKCRKPSVCFRVFVCYPRSHFLLAQKLAQQLFPIHFLLSTAVQAAYLRHLPYSCGCDIILKI